MAIRLRSDDSALRSIVLLALVLTHGMLASGAQARSLNGFDVSGASIDEREILSGGPPRDGIRALDRPRLQGQGEPPWRAEDRVIGVTIEGESRAYPIALLIAHELVNDVLGGVPILVSYCPLCGSALVFDRRIEAADSKVATTFGVSGLLFRSDLLMYDRETESLWSQIMGRAVSGQRAGQALRILPSSQLSWSAWRARHPDTRILSRATGHWRDYDRSPYGDYETSRRLLFPVAVDPRHHPKMRTLGLRWRAGEARAYPLAELERAGGRVTETVGGAEIVVAYDAAAKAFEVDVPGHIDVIETYWFAWMAFHPGSSVYEAPRP